MIKRYLLIFLCVILVAVGASFFLLPSQPDDIIVLRSPETPYRVTPADTGGKDIPHQTSTVMQMIDELDPVTDEVETIKLPGEEPEMPPASVSETLASTLQETSPQQPAVAPERIIAIPKQSEETVAAEEEATPETSTEPETSTATAQQAETDAKAESSPVVMPKKRPDSAPRKKPDSNKTDTAQLGSEVQLFTVQLAAFRDEAKATKTAALLNEKHATRLNGIDLGLMRSDSANGVVYWRVTTEPVPKSDAVAICDTLNRAGQDCIVKKYQQ